jgi:hypothetical protein
MNACVVGSRMGFFLSVMTCSFVCLLSWPVHPDTFQRRT